MGMFGSKKNNPKDFVESYYASKKENEVNDAEQTHSFRCFFKCNNLKANLAGNAPTTRIVLKKEENKEWKVIGETETSCQNTCPKFASHIAISLHKSNKQNLLIEVLKIKNETLLPIKTISALFGNASFLWEDLNISDSNSLTLPLTKNNTPVGEVTIEYEEIIQTGNKKFISIQAEIEPCQSNNADYYFNFFRSCKNATQKEEDSQKDNIESLVKVCNSNYGIKEEKEHIYRWAPLKTETNLLFLDDPSLPLYVELGVKENSSLITKRLFMEKTSIQEIQETGAALPFIFNGVEYGVLKLHGVLIEEEFNFIDYIKSGVNLHINFCLDFTRTNLRNQAGKIAHSENLENNSYALIMRALGSGLLQYDIQQRLALFGYGANLMHIGRSNCFALNGNIFEPEVIGLNRAIEVYMNTLKNIRLGGPTMFSEVLSFCADVVEDYVRVAFQEVPRYFVLIFIVDGSPRDLDDTFRQLSRCMSLPISIIFIGINAQLCKALEEFIFSIFPHFSDNLERSNIHYVQYEEGKTDIEQMEKSVIEEIKVSMQEYMHNKKIEPKKRAIGEERPISSLSQATSSHTETYAFYTDILSKFKKELFENTKMDHTESEPTPGKNKDNDTERPFNTFSKTEDRDIVDIVEKILAQGFPTRDLQQLKEIARNKKYKNNLLIHN